MCSSDLLIISAVSGGTLTLATLITVALSVPVNFLTSTPGMFLVIALAQLCWFFGIHGTLPASCTVLRAA